MHDDVHYSPHIEDGRPDEYHAVCGNYIQGGSNDRYHKSMDETHPPIHQVTMLPITRSIRSEPSSLALHQQQQQQQQHHQSHKIESKTIYN